MFLLYIKRNIFFMSLWVCYCNFKAFVRRYSWIDDLEGKRELIQIAKQKMRIKVLA